MAVLHLTLPRSHISHSHTLTYTAVFHDTYTPTPYIERFLSPAPDALADHIYLDAMGFGMGCCCLQVRVDCEQNRMWMHGYCQMSDPYV